MTSLRRRLGSEDPRLWRSAISLPNPGGYPRQVSVPSRFPQDLPRRSRLAALCRSSTRRTRPVPSSLRNGQTGRSSARRALMAHEPCVSTELACTCACIATLPPPLERTVYVRGSASRAAAPTHSPVDRAIPYGQWGGETDKGRWGKERGERCACVCVGMGGGGKRPRATFPCKESPRPSMNHLPFLKHPYVL